MVITFLGGSLGGVSLSVRNIPDIVQGEFPVLVERLANSADGALDRVTDRYVPSVVPTVLYLKEIFSYPLSDVVSFYFENNGELPKYAFSGKIEKGNIVSLSQSNEMEV